VGYADVLVYSDTVGMLTFALDPIDKFPLTVGANVKVVRRYYSWSHLSYSSDNSALMTTFTDNLKTPTTRWGVDLGFLYDLGDHLNLGLSFEDLIKASDTVPVTDATNPLYGFTTDSAPTVTRFGASWRPFKELSVNGDVDDLFSSTSYYTGSDFFSHIKIGSALTLAGILQLRGGFGDSNIAFGAGLSFLFLGLDYSYAADEVSHAVNHYGQFKMFF